MTSTRNLIPHALLDAIKEEFKLKNDAALARFLDITYPVISKTRAAKLKMGAVHILRVYDATGWSIERIRGYLG